jgi:hypothetical protein
MSAYLEPSRPVHVLSFSVIATSGPFRKADGLY